MKCAKCSFIRVSGAVLLSLLFASVTFRAVPLSTQTSAIHEQNFHSMGGSSSNMTAPVPRDDDFQLAFRESLGFFDDIPAHEWQRMKAITKGRIHHSKGAFRKNAVGAPRYYAANWDPDFSCRFEDSIGQSRADGHKWVCDPHRLAKKDDCLVYSIGSNGNFVFEADLQRIVPNCEIHVFDPTDYSNQMQESGLNSSNYHAWGLKPTYGEVIPYGRFMEKKPGFQDLDFLTLAETMARLGQTGRMIDIFKIDCEGCEWSALKDLLDQNIQQILVEVHSAHDNADQFFDDLHNGGYVTFHKEPNLPSGGKCIEFAFLKLAKEFFE